MSANMMPQVENFHLTSHDGSQSEACTLKTLNKIHLRLHVKRVFET